MKKPAYCPEWFDLEHYKNLENCSRDDWIILVYARYLPYLDLKKNRITSKNRITFEKNYLTSMVRAIDGAIGKGNGPLPDDNCVRKAGLSDLVFWYEDLFLSKNIAVQSLLDDIRKQILEHGDEFNENYRPTEWLNIFDREGIYTHLDHAGELTLTISLGNSDETILSEVKSQLEKARKESERDVFRKGEIITDSEIRSLIDNKVLPYIDLMLWKEITGNKLTQAQMANLLFPDLIDVDVVAKLRQTTIKKAEKLLSTARPKFR